MELWADSLHAGGVPRERIFCHIAFTDQGLRKADAQESYAVKVHFAVPEVAFSSAYRPGFSTYPEGATFKEIYAVLAKHGAPGGSPPREPTCRPTSMPGEPTMETYLGRMFNHGAVMVNIFSLNIGGQAMRDNFFRKAAENPEALAAYAKFLRHAPLVESAADRFFQPGVPGEDAPHPEGTPGLGARIGEAGAGDAPGQKLEGFLKARKWREADKVADELLALMKGEKPGEAKP